MKVVIGPYRKWIGVYQICDLLQYVGVSEDRCNKIGKALSETWIQDFLTWIDSFKKRKIKVHIDYYDTWNADDTLAQIIYPVLVRFKEEVHGAPVVDDEDVPDHLKSTSAPPKKNEWDTDDNHFARWDYVLDEMIFAFGSVVDGTSDFTHDMYKTDDSYVYDRELYNKNYDRIKNGMRLFGKYYFSLWN